MIRSKSFYFVLLLVITIVLNIINIIFLNNIEKIKEEITQLNNLENLKIIDNKTDISNDYNDNNKDNNFYSITYNKTILYDYVKYKNYELKHNDIEKIINIIYELSETYDVDVLIILALVETESNFKINIKMNNDVGLMQINTKIWLNSDNHNNLFKTNLIQNKYDLYKIENNLKSGFYIFNYYKNICNKYKDNDILYKLGYDNLYNCVLNKYNGNKTNIYYDKIKKSLGNIIFFLITNNYVIKE